VTSFCCIRAPDVTPYPARGKRQFYVKKLPYRETSPTDGVDANKMPILRCSLYRTTGPLKDGPILINFTLGLRNVKIIINL
jgi:hypothetical protein